MEKLHLEKLISHKCKPPDHSVLTVNVCYSYSDNLDTNYNDTPSNKPAITGQAQRFKMYCFDNRPNEFLSSQIWKDAVLKIIDQRNDLLSNQDEVDEEYKSFCNILINEMDTYLDYRGSGNRTKKKCKLSKPYWNDNLTALWREMRNAEKEFLAFKGNKLQRGKLLSNFKNARNMFDKRLRYYERSYFRDKALEIEKCDSRNPKAFWDHVKTLGPKKKSNIPLKVHHQDGFSSDPDIVLNTWKSDFESLYNVPDNLNFDNVFHDQIMNNVSMFEKNITETSDYVNKEITFDELEKKIANLKDKKAVGFDGIPNEVLKFHNVKLSLWKLFSKYFNLSLTPTIWLKAMINPIPKGSKKDPYTPINYRGISLLSCVAKVYTGILNDRITSYCEMMDIYVDEQNGFRKGRSCEDHIYSLTSIIKNRMTSKDSTFAAFIDLEKAFDWVDRDLLMYRLLQYNIDGKMYKAVRAIYNHTESCIRLNNCLYSDWFNVKSGVRQGDSLSPTLFSLYLNELAKQVNELNLGIKIGNRRISILLCTDEMVFLAATEADLQQMLTAMNDWCKKWRLKVNESKSNIVHFRKSRQKQTNFKFEYGGKTIELKSEYKYLGVILDEHLTFTTCSKVLADSGGRALGAVISKFKQFRDVGYNTFTKMFETGVIPVMDYGSGVWGCSKNTHSESIQNKACRYFMGVHNFTPLPALHGEMGWFPTKFRKFLSILRYWNRLINMPNERLTKHIFITEYNNAFSDTWTDKVRTIFEQLEMNIVFNNMNVCDLDNCKKILWDIAENEWNLQVENKPKLRTFKKYKNTFETTDYLRLSVNRSERSLLAKFRCGILQLHVESGRFNNTKLENRICNICEEGYIEDEYHFLCICSVYREERSDLYRRVNDKYNDFSELDDNSKFVFLMSKCNLYVVKFLKQAWEKRKGILFK